MSRIANPSMDSASGAAADTYAQNKKIARDCDLNTPAASRHLAPVLAGLANAEGALASGSLSQQELQAIRLLASAKTGCDVGGVARSLGGETAGLPADVAGAIRAGRATGDAKLDALVRFVSHLQTATAAISQHELAAVLAAGYTDTQLVEISLALTLTIFAKTSNDIDAPMSTFRPSSELP